MKKYVYLNNYKITNETFAFLKIVKKSYKYITKDFNGTIKFHKSKPKLVGKENENGWYYETYVSYDQRLKERLGYTIDTELFHNVNFDFVRYNEPALVKNILKLEGK